MSDTNYQRWICEACGFIYDEAQGDPDSGLAPGTRYADIPDDWECPLCGMRKSDLRLLGDPPAPAVAGTPVRKVTARTSATCRGGADYLVIIGAGVAGWSVAEQVRRQLPDRRILMVTACSGAAYSKPALSNALSRRLRADDLVLQSGEQRAADLGIALRAETRVIKVDPARRRITTSKGAIEYGQLVLALGGAQRDLKLQGDAAADVLAVNDLRGYRKLRQHIESGAKRVTILGAGLIGCEFAEDLAGAGIQVDVVDPALRPIARLLSSPLAGLLEQRLAEKGVRWHLDQTVDRVDHAGERLRVTLASGDAFDTDLVMSAAGLAPSTGLAERMGLRIDQGILTDSDMRTSDPAVFALGDCAAVEGRIYNHVESIQQQARAIAGALAGTPTPFSIVSPLVRIKTPSLPLAVCQPVCAGDTADYSVRPSADGLRVEYMHDGKLVGFVLAEEGAAEAAELYQRVQQRVAC